MIKYILVIHMNNKTLTFYNEHTQDFVEGTVTVDFHEVQDRFLQYVKEGSYLLDLDVEVVEIQSISWIKGMRLMRLMEVLNFVNMQVH